MAHVVDPTGELRTTETGQHDRRAAGEAMIGTRSELVWRLPWPA